VKFDADIGRLDVAPDAPAYGTKLRPVVVVLVGSADWGEHHIRAELSTSGKIKAVEAALPRRRLRSRVTGAVDVRSAAWT
jgi:hypothetical protein